MFKMLTLVILALTLTALVVVGASADSIVEDTLAFLEARVAAQVCRPVTAVAPDGGATVRTCNFGGGTTLPDPNQAP